VKLIVTFGDAERLIVDHLSPLLPAATVGVGVPSARPVPAGEVLPSDHLQVVWDGTPIVEYPVLARATVRLVAWAQTTSDAKALADTAQALLLGTPAPVGVASIRPITGIVPARDPDSRAELASFTVQVNLRGDIGGS